MSRDLEEAEELLSLGMHKEAWEVTGRTLDPGGGFPLDGLRWVRARVRAGIGIKAWAQVGYLTEHLGGSSDPLDRRVASEAAHELAVAALAQGGREEALRLIQLASQWDLSRRVTMLSDKRLDAIFGGGPEAESGDGSRL